MQSPEQVQIAQNENPQEEVDVTQLDKRAMPGQAHEAEDFLKGRIAEILGHEKTESEKFDTELSRILKWAKERGANEIEDVLWEVRYLATRLGTPGLGESRIKWLHQYIFLENEDAIIKEQMKAMETIRDG